MKKIVMGIVMIIGVIANYHINAAESNDSKDFLITTIQQKMEDEKVKAFELTKNQLLLNQVKQLEQLEFKKNTIEQNYKENQKALNEITTQYAELTKIIKSLKNQKDETEKAIESSRMIIGILDDPDFAQFFLNNNKDVEDNTWETIDKIKNSDYDNSSSLNSYQREQHFLIANIPSELRPLINSFFDMSSMMQIIENMNNRYFGY